MNSQEEEWGGKFGTKYMLDNIGFFTNEELFENKHENETVTSVYEKMFGDLDRNYRVLEVGCNVGHKLHRLHLMGFKNLYGIDVNQDAINEAKALYPEINFYCTDFSSWKSNEKYDIVMTNYVLIHVSPEVIKQTLRKCYDFSARYLFHMEFDGDQEEEIKWLGKDNICWKRPIDEFYDGLLIERVRLLDLPRSEDNNFDTAILWQKYTA